LLLAQILPVSSLVAPCDPGAAPGAYATIHWDGTLVDDAVDLDRELKILEGELRRLEIEYNMYFAGRLPRPPVDTRTRVTGLVRRLDRLHISNYAERFRFATLQARFQAFIDLWDRGLRAREEGRPGPFSQRPAGTKDKAAEDRILHVAAFNDPLREPDKLVELYHRLADARREVGEEAVSFHKFSELVKDQVRRLKEQGSPEVAFRVAVKDGKVNFTARGLKGVKGGG
jgi:hypothetical protein